MIDYMTEAYERELHRELLILDQSFTEWKEGKIGSGELSLRIHQYDRGPSRDLFERYNCSPKDLNVAYAIVTGILNADEVPAELLEILSGSIAFFQSMKERDELKMPGER